MAKATRKFNPDSLAAKVAIRVTLKLSYREALYLKTLLNSVVGPDSGPRGVFSGMWTALNDVPELDMFYLERNNIEPDLEVQSAALTSPHSACPLRIYMGTPLPN